MLLEILLGTAKLVAGGKPDVGRFGKRPGSFLFPAWEANTDTHTHNGLNLRFKPEAAKVLSYPAHFCSWCQLVL